MDFRQLMNTTEYDFLRTNPRLGRRIILMGLGGSYAYGTNNENSDIDFRGITLNLSPVFFQSVQQNPLAVMPVRSSEDCRMQLRGMLCRRRNVSPYL